MKEKNEIEISKDGLRPAFEKRVYEWRDKYVTRIDRDMTTAFPRLEKVLLEKVNENLGMILKNKPKKFSDEVIEPEVSRWIEQTMSPIQGDAAKELVEVAFEFDELLEEDFTVSNLELMLLPAGVGIGGVGLIIAGFIMGITTATYLFIFTSMVVNWPLLIGAVAVGTVLTAMGAVQLSQIKHKVAEAFSGTFIPKLRECLIGNGYNVDGEHQDSICRQFQGTIECAAEKILANQNLSQRP